MIQIKAQLKKVLEGSLEVAKDSVKQVGEIVDPGKIVEQALGTQKPNEFSLYLKNLDNSNLSPEELARKKEEMGKSDEAKLNNIRNFLTNPPEHMRPTNNQGKELRPYEKEQQEEEYKKAQAVEAQKKSPKSLPLTSKPKRGMLGGKQHAKASTGFETKHDMKSG